MREIKFRAWDKATNTMILPEESNGWKLHLNGCVDYKGTWATGDLELMQFTGLLDKNGKEIYEGDIVRILYSDWGSQSDYSITLEQHKINESQIGTVVFEYCEYLLQFDEYTDTLHHGAHGERHIIGNIYENPELLTPNTQ